MNNSFIAGQTYKMLWIGDADSVTPVTVIKRTKKMVTLDVPGFGEKRVAIKEYEGVEYALPTGNYSMAPRIKANRLMQG